MNRLDWYAVALGVCLGAALIMALAAGFFFGALGCALIGFGFGRRAAR